MLHLDFVLFVLSLVFVHVIRLHILCVITNVALESSVGIKMMDYVSFLLYQLLSAVADLHGLRVTHGNISPSSLMLNDLCWSWLRIIDQT